MKQSNTSVITLTRPDGGFVEGYLAKPADMTGAPAVVVIQEWWGLNDQIRGVADRLAQSGYIALVPDLYRGKVTLEEEEANHLMGELDFADAVSQDIRGAVDYLKLLTPTVAISGYCMGGALALIAMSKIADLSAGVVWYGFPPLDYIDATKIRVPLLAHWALQDEFFPAATVDALELKLRDAGVVFTFNRYLAHHAFANETAVGSGRIPKTQFDPVWSRMAWDRTLTFFGRTLWK